MSAAAARRPKFIRPTARPLWLAAAIAISAAGCVRRPGAPGSTPDGAQPTAAAAPGRPTAAAEAPRPGDGDLNGLPVGVTDAGVPYRGRPDAPVTVSEYSDYQCPFCARHVKDVQPALLASYAANGQVRFEFHDYPIPSLHPAATPAALVSRCVLAQGAPLFWQLHDRLFATQGEWSQAPSPIQALTEIAVLLGADKTRLDACVSAAEPQGAIDASVAEAKGLGYAGTPAFHIVSSASGLSYTIDGAQPLAKFRQVLDAAVAGRPYVEPTPTRPALPAWASAEGLAPDPARPGLTNSGAPHRGDENAVVTVVEFVDYECAPCRKHTLEVQPIVDEQLVASGAVRWVVKNLPLPEHPHAVLAAAAAVCAAEQGRFWEMHDTLFRTVERWAVEPPDAELIAVADETGLDSAEFRACFGGRSVMETVIEDMRAAQDVTTSVPTFVVIFDGQGTVLRGAHAAETFVDALSNLVDQARGSPTP